MAARMARRSTAMRPYGAGKLAGHPLGNRGRAVFTKVQPPTAPGGRFAKDRFAIDLDSGTVTCPNAVTVTIRPATTGGGNAVFGAACAACPLAVQCTSSAAGRTITISRYEAELARARTPRPIPPGSPTTGRPARKWNARSPT